MQSIKFGNQILAYSLKRSKRRKTLSIAVNQKGITVIAPFNVEIQKIEATLLKKAAWIIKQLNDYQEMNKKVQERSFLSGEKLPYLGRLYRLKVIKGDKVETGFRFYQGQFIAELPMGISTDRHRELIYPMYKEWVKQRAKDFTKDRIKRFTLKLQQEPEKIIIKEQEQRWGSCTPTGSVLLNWRIFLAPTSIIDYVLAHELVHLKFMDHSSEYWETLRMLLPDYENRKEWLRLYGSTLKV